MSHENDNDSSIPDWNNPWFTDMELTAKGFSTPEIRAAIEAGDLEGKLWQTRFAVRWSNLSAWLDKRAEKPTKAKIVGPALRSPRLPAPATATGAAMQEFLAVVECNVAQGMARPRAVAAAVRSHHELHVRALTEQRS